MSQVTLSLSALNTLKITLMTIVLKVRLLKCLIKLWTVFHHGTQEIIKECAIKFSAWQKLRTNKSGQCFKRFFFLIPTSDLQDPLYWDSVWDTVSVQISKCGPCHEPQFRSYCLSDLIQLQHQCPDPGSQGGRSVVAGPCSGGCSLYSQVRANKFSPFHWFSIQYSVHSVVILFSTASNLLYKMLAACKNCWNTRQNLPDNWM